jgi:outer membrane protein OmpA-like peptidoglycan-associated protein
MGLDLDGLDGTFGVPTVIVDMTQPPIANADANADANANANVDAPPAVAADGALDAETLMLPTALHTIALGNDAWSEVPTLATEHVQLHAPLRVGLAIGCAALALLVATPLVVHEVMRRRPPPPRTPPAPSTPATTAPRATTATTAARATTATTAPPSTATTARPATTEPAAMLATTVPPPQAAAVVVRQSIPFRLGSTVPDASDEALLAAADRCPGTVVITGHSCSLGSARAQEAVGLARANAVRTRLVAGGFDAARIRVGSAGSRQPVAANATAAGRRENRRVTLTCTMFGGE